MIAQLLSVVICAQSGATDDIPPPAIPSGMDLLYGNRVAVNQNGEPAVAVGIMTGQNKITIGSTGTFSLDFYEQSVHKRTQVSGKHRLKARVIESTPARTSLFVQFETVAHSQQNTVPNKIKLWRERGFKNVKALEDGTVLGVGGNVIDTRNIRIITRAETEKEADQIVATTYSQFQIRASVQRRIHKRPWGRLEITLDGQPLGEATSYIRLSPQNVDSVLRVEKVEYGKGYKWHGYQARSYRGDIYVVVDASGKLAVVNVLGAEAILAGVVPSEIFATAHPESLKAQAVAARNILFSQLGRRHHADPFHLCSAQHCQVYGGITKEKKTTTQAVIDTTGVALFKKGRLVNATYSSTCGGYTEHNHFVWGDIANAALRAKSDMVTPNRRFDSGINSSNIRDWLNSPPKTYCNQASKMRSSTFRWTRRYGFQELFSIIQEKSPKIGRLKDVRIQGRGKGGRVKSLELIGSLSSHTIHYELPIRRFFNNLKSGTFVVEKERDPSGLIDALIFSGGGWGHGVGMCQMGAIGRAEADYDYQAILKHYYNQPDLKKLYEKSTLLTD
ncbi:MAG: SpoIID/LytB domain-containing protein [Deltaproteobacteria bacterium]|nr:SpoIID/LytB domain-containing protein [Deltaproteobacteria bacterium]